MNKYVAKCQKIVSKLIEDSFPKLKGKKIIIKEMKLGSYTGMAFKLPFIKFILLDPRYKNYSNKLLTGLLSHELCHLERWEKRWLDYYFLFGFKIISKKYVKRSEWATDKFSIKKGYAKQLYAQRFSRWRELPKGHKIKEIYPSPTQIKSYAKKIRKW